MYSAGSSQEAGKGNRIVALFESLRNEIEGAANEANMYRQQRDECERKRNGLIPLPHLHELLLSSSDCLDLVPCTKPPPFGHSIDVTVVFFGLRAVEAQLQELNMLQQALMELERAHVSMTQAVCPPLTLTC
jgi:hypothetical protein